MASTTKARAGAACTAGGVTEEAKAQWWLRFNNGVVPADDDGDNEEEAVEDGEGAGAGAERRATYAAVAGCEEAEEMQMGTGDARAEAVARGVEAEMVARREGKAETEAEAEAAATGGKRRSSPRFADPAALNEEISRGNYLQPESRAEEVSRGNNLQSGELPRRKKKAVAKRVRTELNVDGTELQNDISQAQSPHPVLKGPERVYVENENLRLQLALKTTELKQEENRRLQLELTLKSKENESLQKQIEDLKAENEQLRKNAKPERVPRLCRSCNAYVMHDYRNCPKRREAASSPEEEDGEDSY